MIWRIFLTLLFLAGHGGAGSTWPASPGTGNTTTWVYDAASGALLQKIDAQGQSVNYTYDPNTGRLFTRAWARTLGGVPVTETNSYDGYGDLTEQDYSDGTPSVFYNQYNRAGQPREIVDASGTSELAYDYASRLITSTCGLLGGVTVSNHFNPFLGRDAVAVLGLTTSLEDDYGYDAYGRLGAVTSGTNTATYGYAPNSDLLQSTVFTSGGNPVLTTSRTWDYGVRLRSIANVVNNTPVTSHSYQYDALNRRTAATLEDGSVWAYSYDNRDELTGASRSWPAWEYNTPVAGQQFTYAYDNIGNRLTAGFGGDTNGQNLRTIAYGNNSLNEYTNIQTPGYVNILGAALATNSVTVNGGAADRKAEYFHRELTVANGTGPVWQNVTNTSGTFTNQGGLLVPAGTQALTYDADGNLTADGVWTYHWDGENRLISMTMTPIVPGIANANVLQLNFTYDFMGRRVQKVVSTWNGTAFTPQTTNLFVYDGWNLLAVVNTQAVIQQSFMWGNDVSGSMTKADGIGGLLMVSISGTNCFATYDGNGNVTSLINVADKSLAARYEFSAYGEMLRATGPMAKVNPFRFSTKFCDVEDGLICFPTRYYSPANGRWLNRDSIQEKGGINLFAYLLNCPIYGNDPLGNADYNAASVTAAAGAGATIAETDGAQVNEIFALASDAVDAAELEADEVGAVAENDSIAAINQATQVINNLKNTVVAIGRIFSDTGGNDQDAAAELGFGKITMDRGLWSPAMNNMIMQALIKNGNTFYISSRLSMNNMLVNGRLTVTAVELRQLLDAGYTQSGFDMYPPQ